MEIGIGFRVDGGARLLGEIQDNLLVRWFWWALAMVSFCFVAVRDETPLVSGDDYLTSDLFMPGERLTHHGLTDHSVVMHRWYYLPTMPSNDLTRTPCSLEA